VRYQPTTKMMMTAINVGHMRSRNVCTRLSERKPRSRTDSPYALCERTIKATASNSGTITNHLYRLRNDRNTHSAIKHDSATETISARASVLEVVVATSCWLLMR